jgi:hypothetical protein
MSVSVGDIGSNGSYLNKRDEATKTILRTEIGWRETSLGKELDKVKTYLYKGYFFYRV